MALKNFQHDVIMRSYDGLRQKNRRELLAREQAAYGAIAELMDIGQKIAGDSVSMARSILYQGESDVPLASLEQANKELIARKKHLLKAHGFGDDYLDMAYDCPICKDYGYVGNEKCRCFKQMAVNLIYARSNVQSNANEENFSTFSFDYYSKDYVDDSTNLSPYDNMVKVVEHVKTYVSSFGSDFQNLLFMGNTGVGKTFLTNCIAHELIGMGYIVLYLTSFQFFKTLEEYKFNREPENYEEARDKFEYVMNCDLLVIDDLGTEMNNTFTSSCLYQVIDERLNARKSTIISTNLSFIQLAKNYSERTSSRVVGNYKLLKIVGEDIRIKKATLGFNRF